MQSSLSHKLVDFAQHKWLSEESVKVNALFFAAAFGTNDAINLLVKYKADVNQTTDCLGMTAAFLASAYGQHRVLEVLVKAKADVNIPDVNMSTPVLAAAFHDNCFALEILAGAKADLDACNKDSATPLYCAAEQGNYRTVCCLLQLKADVNKVNALTQLTPIKVALLNDKTKVYEKLEQACSEPRVEQRKQAAAPWGLEGVFLAVP